MDEVGRGTTVRDGLAIAFATVHHLYTHNRCRALFATHFHEIIDLLGYKEGQGAADVFKDIGFFCTDVDETMVRYSIFNLFGMFSFLSPNDTGRPLRLFSQASRRGQQG